jgi:Tannase and feruloyl esterase
MSRLALVAAALLLSGPLSSNALAFTTGYSFLDAQQSPLNYRLGGVAPRLPCKELLRLSGAHITILSAETIAAAGEVPEFCRVLGIIQPEVKFEVALPSSWNRRLYMRGNGGYAGEPLDAPLRVSQRNDALRNGFVAVQTNTGHDAATEPLATFATNPQKTIDYAFRSVHETVQTAKRIVQAFYDRPAAYSYFEGCSTGGRQGLMSAQRFPGDFDGIVVGAPVLNFTDSVLVGIWQARALNATPIPSAKLQLIAQAVYRKCDAADGLADGLIDDPRRCPFDPAADLPKCSGDKEDDGCFTSAQIGTLKALYGGIVSKGKPYFPGLLPGAEKAGVDFATLRQKVSGWDDWVIGKSGPSRLLLYGEAFARYLAFSKTDPGYDSGKFDFDKDLTRMDDIRALLDARDPDLSEFKSRGGKILMYFGWADTALSPLMGIDYYEKVTAKMGPTTRDFYRLFMVPGMFHCRGGFGTDRFDAMTPLVNWVEAGAAPQRIPASLVEDGKTVRTRPLCPYPEVARYSGSGSVDDAANFSCSSP